MLLFFVLSLINVILGTLKSISKIQGNKYAMWIQTISYTFYAGTIKLMSEQEMWFVLFVAVVTNILGYYLAEWLFSKHLSEDKLWRISVTVKPSVQKEIEEKLKQYGLSYIPMDTQGKSVVLDIFSHTQGESALIKEIISDKKCKYHVIEINQRLE